MRVYSKKYTKEHSVEAIKRAKEWTKNNIERVRANRRISNKKYYEKNRERVRLIHQISEENRRRKTGDIKINSSTWIEIKNKFDNKCVGCGISEEEVKLTIDHIIPLSKGGRHHQDNIQPLCRSCNSRKGVSLTYKQYCTGNNSA